ncbi:hypothetical protein DFH06DRAFT_1482865 [Mycena polygramma]|nr:hypothetical protein DFH06DRAFT_1482865 [Mycena polygramma]
MSKKLLLVTGATGKQGRALIQGLNLGSTVDSDAEFQVWALTRTISSPAANALAAQDPEHITHPAPWVLHGELRGHDWHDCRRLTESLKPTTATLLIAVEDIGHVAVAVFKNPQNYTAQILVLVGEVSTMAQQGESYKHAIGKALPSIPGFLARPLIALNSHTKALSLRSGPL